MKELNWSADQEVAIEKFWQWFNNKPWKEIKDAQIFYLAGFAGTGKTTLVTYLTQCIEGKVFGASFTGKSASVMRKAGFRNAQTLHSLIYTVEEEGVKGAPKFILNEKSALTAKNVDLLVLDEVSQVDEELGMDALSFGVPVLCLGDPGQLPPISGKGFFTQRIPDATLAHVHRQALESPIIRLATDIRSGKKLVKRDEPGLSIYGSKLSPEVALEVDQFITGKNETRRIANNHIRTLLKKEGTYPQEGERLICLRNDRLLGLFNGLICTTLADTEVEDTTTLSLNIETELGTIYPKLEAHSVGFTDDTALAELDWIYRKEKQEFTYGYCITGHKAQGSQWENVCIVDDAMLTWDAPARRRWLYTCITRASESLTIVRNRG